MDSQPAAAEPNHTYHPSVASWSRAGPTSNPNGPSTPRTPGASTPTSAAFTDPAPASPYPPNLDLLAPLLFSQHQAQLLQYNRLISPGRGGGGGLQPTSLPGLPLVPNIQAAPRSRSRSSSKVSNKDGHSVKQSPAAQSCHGTRGAKNTERHDREGMTMGKDKEITPPRKGKDMSQKTPLKAQPDLAHPLPSRPAHRTTQAHQQSAATSAQSSSVPSTPHQRARDFAFESREPSPSAIQNHSPRSAYSEPNGGAASLPPRQAQHLRPCPYETASVKFRRRMPYSLGADKLEKVEQNKIKSKLSEDESRKLSTDMREIYDRLLPSPEVEEKREMLVKKLEKIFNDEWPGHAIRVHLFGSSGNLLCSDDSDVDICIKTDFKEMEGVCIIADLLHKRGMEKVVCISKAKVPIVKIWDPELKLACDMNVNNTLALENTRMVRTYVEIDDRVRPLAMVIKHWTSRRAVNDAAFGFTLSSYTWICMIIAFLQLRDPPVLPALHQCPHRKLPTTSGHKTEFADDLSLLKGFGEKNKTELGDLLFQFFKFYAHDFDYENKVLSVRLGKMVTKTDKKWNHAMNNMLCVEEPFNTERNLGNTADDFSFRGLHMELRRAFDLVAQGKLEECCEQFVFPKEEPTEPKGFIKPAPRPAIIRSSSQQLAGRGGRGGGGRGNRNHFRNGNSSRRASSSNAYENSQTAAAAAAAAAASLPHPLLFSPGMPAGDLQHWSQLAQHYHYPGDMAVLSNALMAQQDQWQWYAAQRQAQQAQMHAVQHAQRMQAGSAQPTERSRTSSFDQAPPLSAPLRPEYYVWPPHLQPAMYPQQHHPGYGTYPSSPSASTATPEFRRSLHRSNAANDAGSSSSGGTLRSQSQPASRTSAPVAQPSRPVNGVLANGIANGSRQSNLTPFPAFNPDERTDSEADDGSTRTLPDSPPDEDSAGYLGYFVADSTALPAQKPVPGFVTLGDMGMSRGNGRRRLSSDGPQSVLERRLQRTSRSPSPLGHDRTVSGGPNSAPLTSIPFPQNVNRPIKDGSPLVVNGSTFLPPSHLPSASATSSDDTAFDNPLHISQGQPVNGFMTAEELGTVPQVASDHKATGPSQPLVVNGSTAPPPAMSSTTTAMPSFGQRLTGSQGVMPSLPAGFGDLVQNKADPKWQRSTLRSQAAMPPLSMAPLDLAVNPMYAESQHLSPVYETRTPSPTVYREKMQPSYGAVPSDNPKQEQQAKPPHKAPEQNGVVTDIETSLSQAPRANGHGTRESGPLRGNRGDFDNGNGWQKPKSRKKQPDSRSGPKSFAQSEQPPKNELERKGG